MRLFSLFLLFLLFAGFSSAPAADREPIAPPAGAAIQKAGSAMPHTPGAGELYDIKGPIEIQEYTTPLLMGLAALLAIVLLVLLIVLRRRRSGRQRAIQAHEQALQQLARAQQLIENRDIDGFVTLIDQTLRSYIEQRFAISARRMTTHEFISELTRGSRAVPGLPADNSKNLQTWLEHCDLVKFAKSTLDQETMAGMLANLRTFIESTRPEAEK